MFSGVSLYLDEPGTANRLESLGQPGQIWLTSTDLFPFASSKIRIGIASIQGMQPQSGATAAGTLITNIFTTELGRRAGMDYRLRSPQHLTKPLNTNAFCFFTAIEGRYFNMSDSARVDVSDGQTTLRVTTPLTKDRNPGATAQCAQFDQH